MNENRLEFHPRGVTFLREVSAARWIERSLRTHEFAHVGSLIPEGFARYLRLFHPVRDRHGERVSWAEVAAWSGRTVHPSMAFGRIAVPGKGFGRGSYPWSEEPSQGSLDERDAHALAEFLAGFTETPDRCFFAVWEGYGQFTPGAMSILSASGGIPQFPPEEVLTAERLKGTGRDYVLYTGPLSAVSSFFGGFWHASPNIWWPEDRQWCVATDIDLDSSYVGGMEACIEALSHNARFEVLPTTLDAPVYVDADTINVD